MDRHAIDVTYTEHTDKITEYTYFNDNISDTRLLNLCVTNVDPGGQWATSGVPKWGCIHTRLNDDLRPDRRFSISSYRLISIHTNTSKNASHDHSCWVGMRVLVKTGRKLSTTVFTFLSLLTHIYFYFYFLIYVTAGRAGTEFITPKTGQNHEAGTALHRILPDNAIFMKTLCFCLSLTSLYVQCPFLSYTDLIQTKNTNSVNKLIYSTIS